MSLTITTLQIGARAAQPLLLQAHSRFTVQMIFRSDVHPHIHAQASTRLLRALVKLARRV